MALKGIKVIELEGIGPGPQTGMILADFGADVVSVARVVDGKLFHQGDRSRGKRSIALDLKSPEGMAAMRELVKSADVFTEAFRPGTTEKLNLGPKELLEVNPKLVYARLTGWGQGGDPKQEKDAGHDGNYLALGGTLDLFKSAADPKPSAPSNYAGDFAGGGVMAAMGILIALLERRKSGKGQVIDAAMTDGSAYVALPIFKGMLNGTLQTNQWGDLDPTYSVLHMGAPSCDSYECKRDPAKPDRKEWMSCQAIEPRFYAELLRILGIDKEPGLPPTETYLQDRSTWPIMKLKIASAFKTKTRDEWAEIFRGTDACTAPVLNMDEAAEHPHNKARGTFVPAYSRSQGEGKFEPAPAPKLSRTPGDGFKPGPDPAADTRDVLLEVMDAAKVDALLSAGKAINRDRGEPMLGRAPPARKAKI